MTVCPEPKHGWKLIPIALKSVLIWIQCLTVSIWTYSSSFFLIQWAPERWLDLFEFWAYFFIRSPGLLIHLILITIGTIQILIWFTSCCSRKDTDIILILFRCRQIFSNTYTVLINWYLLRRSAAVCRFSGLEWAPLCIRGMNQGVTVVTNGSMLTNWWEISSGFVLMLFLLKVKFSFWFSRLWIQMYSVKLYSIP